MKTQKDANPNIALQTIHKNNNQTTISKRSKVMKTLQLFRALLLILVSILFVVNDTYSAGKIVNRGVITNKTTRTISALEFVNHGVGSNPGTINNAGSIYVGATGFDNNLANATVNDSILSSTNGSIIVFGTYVNGAGKTYNPGTIRVTGDITNGAGTFRTYTGTVEYKGTGNVLATVDLGTYGTLKIDTTGNATARTLLADVKVNSVDLRSGTLAATDSSILDLGGFNLTVLGSGITNSGGSRSSLKAWGTGSTVTYDGNLAQAVFPAIYRNLTLSGATGPQTKSSSTNLTVYGNLSNDANTSLSIAGNFSHSGTITGTNTFSNSGTILIAGNFIAADSGYNVGNINFNGTTSGQTVAAVLYNNLTISGTQTVTFPASTQLALNDGSVRIAGSLSKTASQTLAFTSGNILWYSGTAQTILADVGYKSIWLTGAGDKTVSGAVTATYLRNGSTGTNGLDVTSAGTLTVNGTLDNESTSTITNDGVITVN